ncbi:protein PTCD3 homolog, mitochondrial-like isoform X1 [Varroa jacobsoni]|uniref:protein PTCD3 homolog, mitochondrial-like isoform X1 n=1 Tax=Varroa jacobsoni TaxID=62625 RepID=UPI000BF82516|nr:protein PTCD3 homolog, mitochondrial-like isoform X1 [Varroa jacobsoni]XP_022706490.1 protein PTCD3 homolog, mitochondrial-like isoform X1 [Varroa jacobsoni]
MNRVLTLGLNSVPRRGLSQLVSTHKTSSPEVQIEIPKRIQRGPTDILRALSSTLKPDYTAPHYRYHDDPFLIPHSSMNKRSFSLAKESGRKTARYFLQKYPESFKYDPADPKIAAFNPPEKKFIEENDYTEEDLLYFINNVRVIDAQSVFNSIHTKGVEVSQKTILLLLQLMSFYNCKEAETINYLEELYFSHKELLPKKTWTDGNLAELLFEMLEDKDTVAYSAYIYGLAKHIHVEKAFAMYEEMRLKELVPSLHAYNGLIHSVQYMAEGADHRWKLVTKLLHDMQANGVQPNLITFNNVLELCSRLGNARMGKNYALKTLAEMRKLGIEPSLATYMYVLRSFCKTKGPISTILREIIELLDEKVLVPQEARDFDFFLWAMIVCNEHLFNKDVAYKVNELLEKNPDLLGSSARHSKYYYHFFKLLAETEDIDGYMLVYNKYVPNTYIPETSIYIETLQAIDLNDAFRYLPQVWSDIVTSMIHERNSAIPGSVLSLTARFQSSGTPEDDKLHQQIIEIARHTRDRWNASRQRSVNTFHVPIMMNAKDIGNMIQTFINGSRLDEAWISVQHLIERQHEIVGFSEASPLLNFVQRACHAGEFNQALYCAKYCAEIGHISVPDWMKQQAEKYAFDQKILEELDHLTAKSSTAEAKK